jgi:hypothetical protein
MNTPTPPKCLSVEINDVTRPMIRLSHTLPEINPLYSTDDRCRELLERLRWAEGVICPRWKDSWQTGVCVQNPVNE